MKGTILSLLPSKLLLINSNDSQRKCELSNDCFKVKLPGPAVFDNTVPPIISSTFECLFKKTTRSK